MSTDIKPGQVWAATADHEETYTVREVRDGDVWSTNRYGGHTVNRADLFRQGRTLLTDATPAPLDPKSVHVGDTVTVRFKETGDEIVTKAYQPDDITRSGEWVYILGFPLHRPDGTFGLAFSYFEILAIEPAPEPEWKPGAIVRATVNGIPDTLLMRLTPGYEGGFVWATPTLTPRRPQNEQSWLLYEDADIADVRPLVVIDPAAVDVDALVEVAHHDRVLYGDTTPDQMRRAILRVLAHMGIEATS